MIVKRIANTEIFNNIKVFKVARWHAWRDKKRIYGMICRVGVAMDGEAEIRVISAPVYVQWKAEE